MSDILQGRSQKGNGNPKVTLGFISCERMHYLRATLESARECIEYPNLEWIVIDDDSVEPGLKNYLQGCEWLDQLMFCRQTHAEAMNKLVAVATGEFILIWPEDVQFITRGDWLKDLVEILANHSDLGGICLDAQRLCTLQTILKPKMHERVSRVLKDIDRFGWRRIRRSRKIFSSTGFVAWTYGAHGEGVVGSGIPSLMRTALWRDLGPWLVAKPNARLMDSSLGAEDDMIDRVREKGLCLQMAIPQIPFAADIINDAIGCKAKVRKGIRYGNYTRPPGGGVLYYQIQSYVDRKLAVRDDRPLSFSECVQPIGFEIPKDAAGDRLKASFNNQPQCNVRLDELRSDNT